MKNLINIETKNINDELIQTVNARDLHSFLESKQEFANWIKYHINNMVLLNTRTF
ncbi:MAG: antA/AntB antirepressor family protein [Candidatus Phlomobacter fragariae]